MAKIYRIKVRQVVERVFRVRGNSRKEAEDKAIDHLFPIVRMGKSGKGTITQAGTDAVGTSEDNDQETAPDLD